MFQPRTCAAPDLGSVTNYTFHSNSPTPLVLTNFMDILISPLYNPAPPSVASVFLHPLSCTRSLPTLPAQISVHLDVPHTRHPPASASRLWASHRVSASTLYPVIVTPPPLLPAAFYHFPVRPWGVFSLRVPLHLCDPAS